MFVYSYRYVCSVLCILFHCVVLCIVCVSMCTVLLLPGVNPTAVNKYIIINSRQEATTPNIGTCCYTPAIAICRLKIDVLHSDMAYHRQLILSNIPKVLGSAVPYPPTSYTLAYRQVTIRTYYELWTFIFAFTCFRGLMLVKYKINYYVRSGLGRCSSCYYVGYTNIAAGQGRPDTRTVYCSVLVESSWNVMTYGDSREGQWRENWRMEWVASTLHATSEHGVSSITTADSHTSAAGSRLNWRPHADLNGLVRFVERRNLVFCACAITFQTQSN